MSEIIPFRRRRKRPDIVQEAVDAGRKLPLQFLLEALWDLIDEAARFRSAGEATLARVAHDRAIRIAIEALPYTSPRLAATTISGDPENPIKIDPLSARLASFDDDQVTAALTRISAGENLADILTEAAE